MTEAAGPRRAARAGRWLAVAITAVIAVPIVVGIVRLLLADYLPASDWAITELRVRDAMHHLLTVGSYSRYGWNHPGPMLFYAMVPLYWLSGEASVSLFVTASVINLGCVVAAGLLAWRRAAVRGVVAVMVPLAILIHAFGPDQLREPWNPFLPIIPLFLLVLLGWSIAVGDRWCAVPFVVVGSFIVQSHVGLTLAVVAVAIGAGAVRLMSRRAGAVEEPRGRTGRVAVVTGLAFAVCWAPVVIGTFVRHDGNLRRLVDFFRSDQPTAGLATALRAMDGVWGIRPEWIAGARGQPLMGLEGDATTWWLPIWVGLAIATIVLSRRARDHRTWPLGVVVAAGLIASLVALANVVGPIFSYLSRWTWVFGAMLGVVVALGLLTMVTARQLRAIVVAAVCLVVGLAAFTTRAAVRVDAPLSDRRPLERTIAREVTAALPPGTGPVEIDAGQSTFLVPGLTLALERKGIPVIVTPAAPVVYGKDRGPGVSAPRARLQVYEGPGVRGAHPGRKIASYVLRDSGRVIDRAAVYIVG